MAKAARTAKSATRKKAGAKPASRKAAARKASAKTSAKKTPSGKTRAAKPATRKSTASAAKPRAKAKPVARKTATTSSTRGSAQPAKRPALILNRRGNGADIRLDVMARDFTPRIAERLSDYDEGVSPQVSWSGAPKEAQSYVVMLEDPDAPKEQPFVHWVAYGIPGHIHELPEGLERNAEMGQPVAILQGVNSKGETGYYGPRPPEGPAHTYHLEVFALDSSLDLEPAADFHDVIAAMKGHVLAKGEAVGRYAKAMNAPQQSRWASA